MRKQINLLVDASVYKKPAGGASRIFDEILLRMCDMEPSLKVELMIPRNLAQSLPKHSNIGRKHVPNLSLMESRWFMPKAVSSFYQDQFNRRIVGCGQNKILHATYYEIPKHWEGSAVVTVYDMIHERFAKQSTAGSVHDAFRRKKLDAIKRADKIIAISKTTAKDIQETLGVKSEKIEVIYLGCSEVFVPPTISGAGNYVSNDEPFFLYVGTRSIKKGHYKNFSKVLEAFSKWKRKDAGLLVVGKLPTDEEYAYLADLSLEGRVKYCGVISDQELSQLYRRARALIFPSLYEGFGLPLLEAIACNCPIVASNIPSTVEVAENYPVLFHPDEVDDLIEALETVWIGNLKAKRNQSWDQLKERYDWHNNAKMTLELYKSLC